METILSIIAGLGIGYFVLCLVATQIMDMYEVRTGETWADRVKRLKDKEK